MTGRGEIKVCWGLEGQVWHGGGVARLGKHCKTPQRKSELLLGKYAQPCGAPCYVITRDTGEGPFPTGLTLTLTFSHCTMMYKGLLNLNVTIITFFPHQKKKKIGLGSLVSDRLREAWFDLNPCNKTPCFKGLQFHCYPEHHKLLDSWRRVSAFLSQGTKWCP